MTLDEDVLRDVEAARERLEHLEDAAYEARAAFQQAIRRLHATGGSLREIATALGMSHQRVHQIIGTEGIVEVEPSAVTDVSALPPSSTSTSVAVTAAEDACSFCGAPRRELDKLLAGPGPVFICGGCVGAANLAVQHRRAKGMRTVPVDDDATCSFCTNASAVGGVMAEADPAGAPRICARCTETCRRLMTGDDPPKTMARRSTKVRCSFCNVSQTDTKKLIAGPGVYICGGCVGAAAEVVASATPCKGPRQVVLRPAASEPHGCGFCGKNPGQVAQVVKGGRTRICDECIQLCVDIIQEVG
ncbi:MAG TPA: ClpX C4-type zinc finger protein [Acidimicrobiales bacterium]|nr:ClpX C4-type zinc finger protein [Acidimicrobiales bacterium]